MFEHLRDYYENLTLLQAWTGLSAKICLGSILAAVARGNRRPGQQILSVAFAVLFFWAFFLVFGTDLLAAAVPVLVLGIVFVITAAKPQGEWTVIHGTSWRRWAGLLLLAWAFYYPVFSRSALGAILFSPMGVLPQPILLAAGTLAWLSIPNTPRLAGWALALGLVYFGVIDMMGGILSSAVLLVLGLALGGELIGLSVKAGGVLEDDIPPVARRARISAKAEKEKTGEKRVWKLK